MLSNKGCRIAGEFTIERQACFARRSNCGRACAECARTSRFSLAQIFSIGLRSGLSGGHWRTATRWPLRKAVTFLLTWAVALSCRTTMRCGPVTKQMRNIERYLLEGNATCSLYVSSCSALPNASASQQHAGPAAPGSSYAQ